MTNKLVRILGITYEIEYENGKFKYSQYEDQIDPNETMVMSKEPDEIGGKILGFAKSLVNDYKLETLEIKLR